MKNENVTCARGRGLGYPGIESLDREIARMERRQARVKLALSALRAFLVAAALLVLLTNRYIELLVVDGTSMSPGLQAGDKVLVIKTDNINRGDIVAFYLSGELCMKRVIAAAGESLDIGADGSVSISGSALEEPYVSARSRGTCGVAFPYQVAQGTFFVMGDNRPVSKDSRQFGSIGRAQIEGKAVFRIWPLLRAGRVT